MLDAKEMRVTVDEPSVGSEGSDGGRQKTILKDPKELMLVAKELTLAAKELMLMLVANLGFV